MKIENLLSKYYINLKIFSFLGKKEIDVTNPSRSL
jgi:hypothetical protein